MNKSLLILVLLASGVCFGANAESEVYLFDYLGQIGGVADNGRYAAVSDYDNGIAYLWDSEHPDDLIDITEITEDADRLPSSQVAKGTSAVDVSDDGVVVGSILFKDGHQHPAYYKDGKWELLTLDAGALNTNEAVCITPDGTVIAGYQFMRDPNAAQGGRYFPCQWFLQENGEYELKTYTPVLPNHQGFYPMTQSPDGKIVAGTVYCGIGSRINAMIKDGELVMFEDIVTKREPWMFKGKYYGGVNEETGKQIWLDPEKDEVTDPFNDPRVVLFDEVYINGYRDSEVYLDAFFTNCDDQGNLYGARSRVENVTEDGEGDVITEACIYNYINDEWQTEPGVGIFSAGIGKDLLFTGDAEVINGSDVAKVTDAYSFPESDYIINGINKISRDAKTLGGVSSQFNEAIGEFDYFPFMVVVDGGTLGGVQSVTGDPRKGLVIVHDGAIEVVNAEDVAVYDLGGRLVGTEKITAVPAGVYVVKADDSSYKVVVK